ncbi:hypothetical protein LepocDRAFT_00003580 [Leptothrix ochracea L12]|uniref:Uncharacterized protein n=1 Tax=Leptothrix ochracea L12 TaxID=735332 RepID=I4Z5Y3_9BURK|nr:hypothetical protein LepocDRAFT_00003580 [Leptothrix ochracea L12]
MALVALVMLTTTHLEDANLVVPTLRQHRRRHRCAFNQGRANFQISAATDSQNLINDNLLANFRSNLFYFNFSPATTLYCLPPVFMTAYISAFQHETDPANAGSSF